MSAKFKFYAFCFLAIVAITIVSYYSSSVSNKKVQEVSPSFIWLAPDIDTLTSTPNADLIRYGRELITNTSKYLGPKGTVMPISNGMNCGNCHLDAGTRFNGNNFAAVASNYPKYRDRSGRIESIEYRINECIARSLNGNRIDSLTNEMRAMVLYLKWLGKDVPKDVTPEGAGLKKISFIQRSADTVRGKNIFITTCKRCHGIAGQGSAKPDSSGYTYPPLWGPHSYNVSAGIYRLSQFASYVKNNMPYNVIRTSPQLTDEEAWDVAAFVNSQQRPEKFFADDWPKINTKPVDYPFGPFADGFTEVQHKYGPFEIMKRSK